MKPSDAAVPDHEAARKNLQKAIAESEADQPAYWVSLRIEDARALLSAPRVSVPDPQVRESEGELEVRLSDGHHVNDERDSQCDCVKPQVPEWMNDDAEAKSVVEFAREMADGAAGTPAFRVASAAILFLAHLKRQRGVPLHRRASRPTPTGGPERE